MKHMDQIPSDVELINAMIDEAIMGTTCAEPSQGPPLTYQYLKDLHDYLKPEKVTVGGEELEIYGYNVHRKWCPEGVTVLTEKQNPGEPLKIKKKLVIIDERKGQALIYDPTHNGS